MRHADNLTARPDDLIRHGDSRNTCAISRRSASTPPSASCRFAQTTGSTSRTEMKIGSVSCPIQIYSRITKDATGVERMTVING